MLSEQDKKELLEMANSQAVREYFRIMAANRHNLFLVNGVVDTFGGVQTPPFRAGKGYAALSINPEQTTVFRPWCRRIDLVVKDL